MRFLVATKRVWLRRPVKQNDEQGTEIPDSRQVINNIYLDGVRVAAMAPNGGQNNGQDVRYYLTDQVDSVKLVLDDDAEVVSRMEYLPYGGTFVEEDLTQDENHAPKYNSQELDQETGYYFYNARHYDAEIGRFITPDTVIDGQNDVVGWNRFTYVRGNPIRYKDPTGHMIIGPDIGGGERNSVMNSIGNWLGGLLGRSDSVEGMTGREADESPALEKDYIAGKLSHVKSSFDSKTGVAKIEIRVNLVKGKNMSEELFANAKKQFIEGVEKYWGTDRNNKRPIDLGRGQIAKKVELSVTDVSGHENKKGARVVNFHRIDGSSNAVGDIDLKWPYAPNDTDRKRQTDAAHEFGHDILASRVDCGKRCSASHRGESTYFGTHGDRMKVPKTGTISVMQYFRGEAIHEPRFEGRVGAIDSDIRALFETGQHDR